MQKKSKCLVLPLEECETLEGASELVQQTRNYIGYYEIGKGLINAVGLPRILATMRELGVKTFVNTQDEEAVNAAVINGADIVGIPCSNSLGAMVKTVAAAKKINPNVKIIGVPGLTNLNDADMRAIGCLYTAETQVWNLAQRAKDAGFDGFVCEGRQIPAVRAIMGPDAIIIVSDICMSWNLNGDQKKASVYAAIRDGANLCVVRTQNGYYSSQEAAQLMHEELTDALLVAPTPPQTLTAIFINRLIKIGAIRKFTSESEDTSRIYISISDLPNHPDVMSMAVWLMKMKLGDVQFNRVGGVPMGALSIANMLSLAVGKPVLTLREQSTVEKYKRGDDVLVVKDVGTTGSLLINSINKYHNLGLNVRYAIVVVDSQQGAQESLNKIGVELLSLITMHDIAAVICYRDDINEGIKNYMRRFL